MITASNVSLNFGARKLFEDVNIKFAPGNCYGLIGANGAGKSTFLKILAGEIHPTTGDVSVLTGERIAMLKQNHFEFDQYEILKTVIMGHQDLYKIIQEREQIYAKADFTDEDGVKAGHLEEKFAEMNGYESEAEAGVLLAGLGIGAELLDKKMQELTGAQKVKVLLAQALFGKPDILLLDEPTNHLDIKAIYWLENFLLNFERTVIVVSHDRHFLNKVCTHMADIDFGKIQLYTGNYDFWYESSQLALRMAQDKNKKMEDKIADLKGFIQRFSANASKSRQASSRQKLLDKITLDDIKPSTRKYPAIVFIPEREAGNDLLRVQNLSKTLDGVKILDQVSFIVNKGQKIVFVGENEIAITALFQILSGELAPDSGSFNWGVTTTQAYFPKENKKFFDSTPVTLVDWLRQYSKDKSDEYVRGFLGRMLFSGEEALKKTNVLSGGEKVRCMLAKMMLGQANVLLLDGPTNHLDLESITAVNTGLIKFNGTVLFSSHDHQFVETVANRVLEINKKGQLVDQEFTYEEYLESLVKK